MGRKGETKKSKSLLCIKQDTTFGENAKESTISGHKKDHLLPKLKEILSVRKFDRVYRKKKTGGSRGVPCAI